jgi:hypothetical protein
MSTGSHYCLLHVLFLRLLEKIIQMSKLTAGVQGFPNATMPECEDQQVHNNVTVIPCTDCEGHILM